MAETQENQNRLAFAIIRHGLAKRFALTFLTLPGVGDSTNRLLFFFFLLAIACVSMFVSDGAAVAMAQLEALTGSGIGWFSWMMVGVPIFATLLVCNHFVLRFFFGPDVGTIPGGRDFLLGKKAKLGKMSTGEKCELTIFIMMAALFILPSLLSDILGEESAVAVWVSDAISIWMVPASAMGIVVEIIMIAVAGTYCLIFAPFL